MKERAATKALIALACCSVSELQCNQCPYYNPREADDSECCRPWTNEEVTEAVNVLNKWLEDEA